MLLADFIARPAEFIERTPAFDFVASALLGRKVGGTHVITPVVDRGMNVNESVR